MSKSRSPTPTPTPILNPLSYNISPLRSTCTPRLSPHGESSSRISLLEGHLQRHIPRHVSDSTMARHFHGRSPQIRGRSPAQSNTSSDSQDLQDTEMDDKGNQASEAAAASTHSKKKRTRTLTTPHQSAVLYALLAKSRFPSTAVREEVGKSIGLSARKVQIWFQNQRQKARRPHTDKFRKYSNEISTGSSTTSANSVYSFPDSGHPSIEHLADTRHYGYHPESVERLSGPGMPGSDFQTSSQTSARPVLPFISRNATVRPASSPCYGPNPTYLGRSMPPSSPAPSRPTTASGRSFSRTLPPLISTAPKRSTLSAQAVYPQGRGLGYSPLSSHSASPDTPFAHHPPDIDSTIFRVPSRGLIPPLPPQTLHVPSFSGPSREYSRTVSELWPPSRGHSPLHRPMHSPASTTTMHDNEEEKNLLAASGSVPVRVGRYDPVRATFIVTTPPEPQSLSKPAFESDLPL